VVLHVAGIRALVAAIARSLARAPRVDSFHLCRLVCEESERARERNSERKRKCESEKESETERERIHRRSFVNTTRLFTIYRIVPQDCCETVRHSEQERAGERERAKASERHPSMLGCFTQLHLGCEDTKGERARETKSERAREREIEREGESERERAGCLSGGHDF